MKNPIVYYAVMAIGVIGLALGVYWTFISHHPTRGPVVLALGAIILIAGVVGFFVMKPKATAS